MERTQGHSIIEDSKRITGQIPDISLKPDCLGTYVVGFRYGHSVYVTGSTSHDEFLRRLRTNSQDVIRLMENTIRKINEQLGE